MPFPQGFGHLHFRCIWRSKSFGFPKYVWGKDCDIIVTFLTGSSDVWCMFLRHLMPVPQTFDACSSSIWCLFLRRLMHVPQTFDACSSGFWSLILRVRMKKYILWVLPKYVWGKDCDICDISNMFPRRLMRVPPAFDACSSDVWSLIIRVHMKKYTLWVPKVYICLG